ncbi:hypothetical protein B0H13DRAFT_1966883 [Mycena leptocephala]|nr:hypothetical protein B0H13DRAFT_1966883 [Mycena leptocephala]
MFATFLTIALFAASAINGVSADDSDDQFSVNTPSITQCGEAKFSWEATKGPYNLIIVKSTDPCGDIIKDLGDHNGTTLTWPVTLPAGGSYSLSIEDADGREGWSGAMKVLPSSNTTCLDNAAAASGIASGHSASSTAQATAPVAAAGAAVTGGTTSDDGDDSDSDSSTGPLGAASGSGASGLHMNPIMALCALFAVALAL